MNHLTSLFLTLALATAAATSWAESVNDTAEPIIEATEATSGVIEGISVDASPEIQAERDEMVAQWEADARAAGIDPETAEAGTVQN